MEFVISGKLRECEIFSGNFCISDAIFLAQSETHNKPTCKLVRLQWCLCELLVMVCWMLVDIIILGGDIVDIGF